MKILKKAVLFIFAVCAVSVICGVNLFADENNAVLKNGTYTMNTVTSYINPDTGKTDDGGTANVELGEGMCRSAVYEKASVELNDDGAVITMRILLYSNLSDIRLSVQDEPKGKYTDIKYSIVKESSSNDSADIRFTAPSADSLVRVQMYVTPMGRDVCFYFYCDAADAVSSEGELDETQVNEKNDETDSKFSDIDGHWAKAEIINAVNEGLFSGVTETEFQPDGEITRGMFVTVLGRMSGEDISGTSSFSDVDNSKYYAPYIAWASKNNIVNGMSGDLFSPDTPVTCEQAAVILVKYAEYKNTALKTKSISPSTTGVSQWAEENVIKAGKAGIITKQNTNGYDYTSSATRADAASMISNYMKYYA